MKKSERKSGSSRVFERLRRAILEGEYAPNERLID